MRRLAAALAFAAALLVPPAVRAVTDADLEDVDRLARSSVEARFTPDPADPRRDLVTGQRKDELEGAARDYYDDLLRRDPERFERVRRRMLGEPTADDLDATASAELAEGRNASAELAWERIVHEHPDSPKAAPALMKLASSRLSAGDRTQAAEDLARLPEMDLELAYQAAPLMSRLLKEIDDELARRPLPPKGGDKVSLHPSLQSKDLDRVRELSEWTSGYALLDDVARTLRLETSGDVMRVIKGAGNDDVKLDTLVGLIPLEHRQAAVKTEERLKDPTDLKGADARAAERSKGKNLDRFEHLARLQQLQVLLLARTLEDLELEPEAQRLGDRTLNARRELAARIEALLQERQDKKDGVAKLSPEEAAVAKLVRLADCNADGRITPLRDDEGMWRPNRFAVEGDMRNAVTKPLDDDNDRRVADLFQQTGLTEQALFAALVRATTDRSKNVAAPRVSPERTDRLLSTLAERSKPVWDAAPHPQGKSRPGDAERDYLARLSVLRLPGEALEDVIVRELLDAPSEVGSGALAGDGRAGRLLVEMASLGRRYDGAWLFEDDAPTVAGGRTASQKLQRAQEIRGELDDVSAGLALDQISALLVTDLESQGFRFTPFQREQLRQTIQHEDLGTLALQFNEFGDFTKLDHAIAMTEPGTALGTRGPGHVAYGFGLDMVTGAPGVSSGWRGGKELKDGAASLSYHVGAAGTADGPADQSGVSARFRRQKVWQPEVGADASILRGLTGRGFFNLIRDVTLKHERRIAAVFSDHEAAKANGRAAFLASVSDEKAQARPAVLFTRSLGHGAEDMEHDDASYRVLTNSYEFEKARQRSLLDREANVVRFAGFGFTAAFFAGDVFLLAGPKIAVKDFRLFSHLVDSPSLRVQSEEAGMRRAAVSTWPRGGTIRRQRTEVALDRGPDASGALRFVPRETSSRVSVVQLHDWPEGEMPSAPQAPLQRAASEQAPVAVLASAQSRDLGVSDAPARPEAAEPPSAERLRDRGLARLSRALRARGVPLAVEAGEGPNEFVLVPAWLTPWCSQAFEIYASEDDGLGIAIDAASRPVLIAPDGLDGVVLDAMQERRSITRPGEADELWRVALSIMPGKPAAAVVEGSARLLRCEVVDGRLIGTAAIATRHRLPDGTPRVQANVLSPADAGAPERLALIADAAAHRGPRPLPEMPAVALRPAEPADDGTISDPDALAPEFIALLRRTQSTELAAFKTRSINHAAYLASGGGTGSELDPDNVAYIQSRSIAVHGRPLSGEALQHAHFVLTHEGLFNGDRGAVADQTALLERRAVLPFGPDREISGAADPASRRIIEAAGIDEAAALRVLGDRMKAYVVAARTTGKLERTTLEPGTRIVTASWSGPAKGVQWTTATEPVEAHLLEPLSLKTNEGKYVTALGLGPDIPALANAVAFEMGGGDAEARALEPVLEQGIAQALANPQGERRLRIPLQGAVLELDLAEAPRAGALARCKNATLFPPAYGAVLEREREQAITAAPAAWVGAAEAASRFEGSSWAGWRRLSLLAGAPLAAAAAAHHDDDDDGGGDDGGGGGGVEPPPRDGSAPPDHGGGRGQPPGRGGKPVDDGNGGGTTEPPRDGGQPPGRGGGRGQPPDREKPGDGGGTTQPPRDGAAPPGRPGRGRPNPPNPSDRPRRPVD